MMDGDCSSRAGAEMFGASETRPREEQCGKPGVLKAGVRSGPKDRGIN